MAAVTIPAPLVLPPRFTTEEAEQIWLSTNGGILASVSSTMSNLSECTRTNVFTPNDPNDFVTTTPITSAEEAKWLENTTFVDIDTATDHVDMDHDCKNDAIMADAKWLETADPDNEITAQPITDDTVITLTASIEEENPLLAHPIDWTCLFPSFEDVEDGSADDDDESKFEEDTPIAKRPKKQGVTVSSEENQTPPQMPVQPQKMEVETRKSGRTRKTTSAVDSKEKKKPSRRRSKKCESKTKVSKKPCSTEPIATKRKREERLRRNRESANRSRIRKKKEMQGLKENVVVLRQKVVTLSSRIEELEDENQDLRGKLAMYKKPGNSYTPAVTVFALVFTVAFFTQSSALPQAGLAQLSGQGAPKVFGPGAPKALPKAFFLASFIDLFSNNVIDAALSTPILPMVIGIATKVVIAFAFAAMCALCFHYAQTFPLRSGRKRRNNISYRPNLILETV